MLTNRRVGVEIHKTLQEVQFEPLKVVMFIHGDIPDNIDAKKELETLGEFIENLVYDRLEKSTT
jgi:hypothetical protein